MRMNVPYVALTNQWASERQDLLPIIEEVMSSGGFIGGDRVEKFEVKAARYCKREFAVALNSGTDALVCALIAVGVRRGDEVITPSNSFVASTAAIVHIGAKPVFVDVEEDQLVSTEKIKNCITGKTKAIMPVHLTGRMCEMDEITKLAQKFNIPIIEDCAQSIGSKYNGVMSGSFGEVGCFSTHPLKNLNACGDGGFIVTDNPSIYKFIKEMRNHGLVERNLVKKFGYVSRMDTLQAAILDYRLDHLEDVIRTRRKNAEIYRARLNNKFVFIPKDTEKHYSTYHTFVIQVNFRDDLIEFLAENGVATAVHYGNPIHLQPAAKYLGYGLGSMPNTEKQSGKILSLPINQFLTKVQVEYVADLVNSFLEQKHAKPEMNVGKITVRPFGILSQG